MEIITEKAMRDSLRNKRLKPEVHDSMQVTL